MVFVDERFTSSIAKDTILRGGMKKKDRRIKGNIDKIHEEFNKNYSQLISRGATVDDPVQILFDAYDAVPCYNFKKYIMNQQDAYLDGKLAGQEGDFSTFAAFVASGHKQDL